MSEAFKSALPHDLANHVLAGCGEKGKEWLEKLPSTLAALEGLWSLKVLPPFPGIEFNFVAPAVLENGEQAVVKVAPPWEPVEIFREAAYLRCRNGNGAIRLIAEDRASRGILLERSIPGKSLTECFKNSEPDSVVHAIEVLRMILRPAADAGEDIILLDDWVDGLRRYGSTGFPASYAEKALHTYESLSKQPNRTFYIHGDFHPGNLVSTDRADFLAIDPKGVIGHIGYEIAVFLNNFHWWQEEKRDIRPILEVAVRQFSEAFEVDSFELRQWAYVQMVLSAWWMFDEMPDVYNNEVAKADIWDV
jgi:streptomycin 6-kinase